MTIYDPEALEGFLQEYKQYVEEVLEPTRREVRELLMQWKEPSYWTKYQKRTRLPDPSPIQRISSRVKRPESVVDKVARKPESFPHGLTPDSFISMTDVVGARIVVYFLAQIPLIDKEIRDNGSFEISTEHPPIAYLSDDLTRRLALENLQRQDKESGYASVHYILRLRDGGIPENRRPWFELQVRTLTEDNWAEIEHILGYKPGKRTSFAVRKQFRIISAELMAIDEHFNFLYEELARFQEEVIYRDSDPLNAENLPGILAELGLSCAQREIDSLLKLLMSRKIETIGELRTVATSRNLEILRNAYRREESRPPNNFEVVANLANLIECVDEAQITRRIKTQIDFLRVWDEVKRTNNN